MGAFDISQFHVFMLIADFFRRLSAFASIVHNKVSALVLVYPKDL